MDTVQFIDYKIWANRLLYETVRTLPEESIRAPHPIVFGSLINTLNHVLTVDLIFKAHLLGQHHGFTTRRPKQSPPLTELWQAQSEADAWYRQYAIALSRADLDEIVRFQFIGGDDGAMTREQILLHIVNHGTYHRGHIGTMLYQMAAQPPTTDFPVFLRQTQT